MKKNVVQRLLKAASVSMVMSMLIGLGAFAAGADNGAKTITIENPTAGYEYEAYQLLTGDLDGGTLSNITWGSSASDTLKGEHNSAAAFAKTATQAADKAAFAKSLYSKVENPVATSTKGEGTYTLSVPKQGYYLVKSKTVPEEGAATAVILTVTAGNVSIKTKSSVPSVDKSISKDGQTYQNAVSVAKNDIVTFKLEATLPSDNADGNGYSNYATYALSFTDTMKAGMVNEGTDFDVFVDDTKLDDKSMVTASGWTASGKDLTNTFAIADAKQLPNVHAGSKITITYKAKVETVQNEYSNSVSLTYSNDPNTGGTGTLRGDEAKAFSYNFQVKKNNEKGEALEGASFHIDRMNGGDVAERIDPTTEGNKFNFAGLKAGKYRLVEDVSPSGYNKMSDYYFTVSEVIDQDQMTVTSISAAGTDGAGNMTANLITDLAQDRSLGDFHLSANVANEPGINLPGTGGNGVYVIYGLAAIALIGGAVLFIRKRTQK